MREVANEGKRDFDAGRFDQAEGKFQRAFAVARVPTLAVWLARSLEKQGHLVTAAETYRLATKLTPNDLWIGDAQEKAQADAKSQLAALLPRIPRLRVVLVGVKADDVEIALDGTRISPALVGVDIPADPGPRAVVGVYAGQTVGETVDLAEGQRQEVALRFTPAPPATVSRASAGVRPTPVSEPAVPERILIGNPPAPAAPPVYQRWWFWTGIGAAVAAGTVTAILLARRTSGGLCDGEPYPCGEIH